MPAPTFFLPFCCCHCLPLCLPAPAALPFTLPALHTHTFPTLPACAAFHSFRKEDREDLAVLLETFCTPSGVAGFLFGLLLFSPFHLPTLPGPFNPSPILPPAPMRGPHCGAFRSVTSWVVTSFIPFLFTCIPLRCGGDGMPSVEKEWEFCDRLSGVSSSLVASVSSLSDWLAPPHCLYPMHSACHFRHTTHHINCLSKPWHCVCVMSHSPFSQAGR